MVVVNCHILYRDSRKLTRKDPLYSLLAFQEALIAQLGFNDLDEVPVEVLNEPPGPRRSVQTAIRDIRRCQGLHEPLVIKRRRSDPNRRKVCIWCRTSGIMTMCATCNVPLCLKSTEDDENEPSCFYKFHSAPLPINN